MMTCVNSTTLGALCALPPGRVILSRYEQASNNVCEECNDGSEADHSLLIYSFCNLARHNLDACLGGMKPISRLCVDAVAQEWVCVGCWKEAAGKARRNNRRAVRLIC